MKKTILISAYAVNPFKGSEDGTGWNISREMAKEHDVIVVTRKNNVPHIERYLNEQDDPIHQNMEFIGYDLPQWTLWLKKRLGERGYVLYYYFWQLFLPLFVKRMKLEFDIAHALNFHSDSVPTFLWMLGKPTYWGPVGHHPAVPKDFILPIYGRSAYLRDQLYFSVKWALRNLDPFFHLAVKKVEKIFVINSSVASVMGAPDSKVVIVPAVATDKAPAKVSRSDKHFKVLSVGRFHYMKGFDIAIRSFKAFYEQLSSDQQASTELILVGKGEERQRLTALIASLGMGERVRIVDWVDKSEMAELYGAASAFLFPSHEGAGMVIPEAMSYGLPVLTFDNVGPGELAGSAGVKTGYGSYDRSVDGFAESLLRLHNDRGFWQTCSDASYARYAEHFTWEAKGNVIRENMRATKTMAVFHPSSELYGADRILVNALKAMPEAVRKVVYLRAEGPLTELLQSSVSNIEVKVVPSMPVIYRGIFHPIGLVRFGWNWLRFARFLRKEHRANHYHSAYVNTLSCTFLLPALRMFGIQSFVHVHEIIESPRMIGLVTAHLCRLYARQIICVSDAVRKNMLNYAPSAAANMTVLHNGIDAVKVPLKSLNGTLRFYLFGRIMPKKGQWYLLEALKLLPREELTGSRFTLMGGPVPGQEYRLEELKQAIQDAQLEDIIELKGFANNISDAMSEADVCLVPSMMKDPFPTTVLEAMSAGKPVIATNHGGAVEAINGSGAGELVDPGKPRQLAESILRILSNREQIPTMGQNAKKRYTSAFTMQHFSERWNSVLSESAFV